MTTKIRIGTDGEDFTLTFADLSDKTDRDLLRDLITLQRDAAAYIVHAANRDLNTQIDRERPLTQFDYNGDHVDYNPSAAAVAAAVTNELCADGHFRKDLASNFFNAFHLKDDDFILGHTHSIRASWIALLQDESFCFDLMTWGESYPNWLDLDYDDEEGPTDDILRAMENKGI